MSRVPGIIEPGWISTLFVEASLKRQRVVGTAGIKPARGPPPRAPHSGTLASRSVLFQLFRKKLERDKMVQPSVLGLVHHTHAAAAEPLDDAVMRDGLADDEVCSCRWLARMLAAHEEASQSNKIDVSLTHQMSGPIST
jgi:hypothetical protein